MGPIFRPTQEEESKALNNKKILVVGKFKDRRGSEFIAKEIQSWIYSHWRFRGLIIVEKVEDLFLLKFTREEDCNALLRYGHGNYKGALIVFKRCLIGHALRSMNFDGAYLWVQVEGLPVHYSTVSIASRVLARIGQVLCFDKESLTPPPPPLRGSFRVKVWISLNRPLIPRFYFEFEQGSYEWVDFRYEGVFVYCRMCGVIGHKVL
uniref:Zinc knuckle CX2CX4HX4C domain-containing protein n=1 Tax=Chenopodium quinoa TaxID=63459 RepID=A0A803N571_CHEQI